MALIARIQHPYIVEFKEAWVEKVRHSCLCVYVDAYIRFVSFSSLLDSCVCPELEVLDS